VHGRGLFLSGPDTLCTSGFVDDVTFFSNRLSKGDRHKQGVHHSKWLPGLHGRFNRPRCRLGYGLEWAQGTMNHAGLGSPNGKRQFFEGGIFQP